MKLSEKLQTMATLARLQEEGKQLQYRLTEDSGWVDEAFTASMPAEYFYAALWRVRPEPQVRWIVILRDKWLACDTQNDALFFEGALTQPIRVEFPPGTFPESGDE